MARIAIGGWQHETNTFATIKAGFESFATADEWPALCSGDRLFSSIEGVHLPITGALKAIQQYDHEIVPLLWCSATPCSYVTSDAFERISDDMINMLRQALPLDGVYLDLHGAMVSEKYEDGEGEFLRRVRECVGPSVPIFVSLDLHANVTQQMVNQSDVLDIYRTYPHIDMGETGYRVAKLLCEHIKSSKQIYKSFKQINFLIPLNTGCTLIEPCQSIYHSLPELIQDEVVSLSFACGFHLSDIHDAGPAVVAYGYEQGSVDLTAQKLVSSINAAKERFYERIWPVAEGITEAQRLFEKFGASVVIADTQDNPGGGGAGDTIGVLEAMIEQNLVSALIGVINDAEVAELAHKNGPGAVFSCLLGGKAGVSGQSQLQCHVEVVKLSDGRFTGTGPMYKGANMELGATALLKIANIFVVVCSKPVQTADQAHFKHLGVDPATMDYVAVKSSVHFRNDFEKMASRVLVVAAPGEVFADPGKLQYQNIRAEIERTSLS